MEKYLEDLVEACIKNDRKSQEIFYHTYSKIMFGVCLGYTKDKEEAKDVLQEGFIKVFRNLKKYNGTGSIEGWIRRIMINTSIDFYRQKVKKKVFLELNDVPETQVDVAALEELNVKEVLDVVNRLPEGAKIIFNLHVVEGYTHQEIGKLLNISDGTSKSQFWRSKKLLQKMLNDINGVRFSVGEINIRDNGI